MIGTHNSQRLTPTLRKMADEYSSDVFGSRRYAPWLYVYSLVSGQFKEGWIPDNFFGRVVSPRVNREVGVVTSLKSFSNVVLKTEALPDIGYYIGGNFYNRDLAVTDPSRLRAQCGSTKGKLFVKKDRSSRGEGIITLPVEQLTEEQFSRIGDCVIQLPITQNEFFEEMIAGSVATIRLTTVKDQTGRIDVRAAYLRLGRSNTEWVQSDNSIKSRSPTAQVNSIISAILEIGDDGSIIQTPAIHLRMRGYQNSRKQSTFASRCTARSRTSQ